MKTYLLLVTDLLLIVVSFGIILPWLISYPDTALVIAGVIYGVLLLPVTLYYLNRKHINKLINSFKENAQ